MRRPRIAPLLLAVTLLGGACVGAAPSPPSAPSERPADPSTSGLPSAASPSPSAASAAPAGIDLSAVPTACIGLGADDCRRVVAMAASVLPSGVAPAYIQVGPFGCAGGEGCATSLVDRPEGDITLEAGVGALSYHVRATAGGAELALEQQDAFGVRLGASSQPPIAPGARPFSLGHCGLWSGIDFGGSWWDPIGTVDGDHPDAINAADGTITVADPDRATFTSRAGLTVELLRRDGEKYLPLCQ